MADHRRSELQRQPGNVLAPVGPLFNQSAVGFPYELLVELSSASGTVEGYVWLDTSVQSLMATDEDLGDAQDAGWLTDAGDVTLASGEVVGVHAGIRDQGDGTQKVVVKVTGDSDLAAEGIIDATVTLGSTNGGPEAAVAPIAGLTSSRQVLILKKGQATGPIDAVLSAAAASGQVAIGASLFDANDTVLLVQPNTVSELGSGNSFNVTAAPDAGEAITPWSVDSDALGQMDIAELTSTSLEVELLVDAHLEAQVDAPGGDPTSSAPMMSLRSGTKRSWNDGYDPAQTLNLEPGDAPVLMENIFTSPDSDQLYVGIGSCEGGQIVGALPVDGAEAATIHLDRTADGQARFTLTSGGESTEYLTDIVSDGSDTSDTSDTTVTGAIEAASSVELSSGLQGGAPTGDTTGEATNDDGSTASGGTETGGTETGGTETGGTCGTSPLGEAGVVTIIDREGNWVRAVTLATASAAEGGGKTGTCFYGCYAGTSSHRTTGGSPNYGCYGSGSGGYCR